MRCFGVLEASRYIRYTRTVGAVCCKSPAPRFWGVRGKLGINRVQGLGLEVV